MKSLFYILMVFSAAACANTTADIMLGGKVHEGGFYGNGPTVTLEVRKTVTGRFFCKYQHVSFLTKGRPFGPSDEEDSLDQVGCGLSFGNREE